MGSSELLSQLKSLTVRSAKTAACICHPLHSSCDPSTCAEVSRIAKDDERGHKLGAFVSAAADGCPTCKILVAGINLPQIKKIWFHGKVAENDHDVDLLVDYRGNIRVTDHLRSRYAEYWHHFNLFQETEEGGNGCMAFPVSKTLSDSTKSETSWSNLKDWLEECEGHEACKREVYNPRRVVDVGTDEEPLIRLVSDLDLNGALYTTLSYSWGKWPKFVTTKTTTLADREKEILWSSLPLTFQHAIQITRRLSVRYIWIDSLCILQDSLADWEVESSKMAQIYQNSYLTISATKAKDTDGGCFSRTPISRGFRTTQYSNVNIKEIIRSTHHDFAHHWARDYPTTNPLPRRAWALQERLLSPRSVNYLNSELVWECNTLVDCQCKGIHTMGMFKPAYHRSLTTSNIQVRTHDWLWILEVFTSLGITKISDHLPALSGLARQAKDKGWGQYAAGLWKNEMEYTACFEMKGEPKRTVVEGEYLGPSWSWVGKTRGIAYSGNIRASVRRYLTPLVKVQVVDTKTGVDPTGSVTDAFMRVKGTVVSATLDVGSWEITTTSGHSFDDFRPDEQSRAVEGTLDIKLLPWMLSADSSGGDMITMVLVRAEKRKGGFFEWKEGWSRLGMFRICERGKDFRSKEKFEVWREGKEEVLVLV